MNDVKEAMPKNRASIEELLKAGSHFGHLTSRWNPKMKPFIFMKRNGIHIINLNLTQKYLDEAGDAIARFARRGKRVLFTGTKKQAQDIIRKHAEECGSPYVVERWLGGTLTNFATIRKSIRRMEELIKMEEDGTLEQLKKKERLMKAREREKLEKVLTGIQDMARIPGAIFVVDIRREHIAVREAKKLGIPIIAIVDTNCDPDLVDYPIPANDDALKSVDLITGVIASAVAEGQKEREIQEAEAKAEKERLEQENAKARAAKKAAKAEEDQAAADKKGEETPDSDAKAGDEADTANGKAETAAPEAADSGDETDKVAAEARVEDGKSEVAQKTEAEKVQ